MVEQTGAFFENGARMVKLTDWLHWASGSNDEQSWRVVLPMIQRGAVWRPHQIMDLWDTLLRGMPLGSMLANTIRVSPAEDRYFAPLSRDMVEVIPERSLSLLDGQQRTLAMLQGWSDASYRGQRVWIDMGDTPPSDHLFRYQVTTLQQPFGFQHASMSGTPVGKLSLHDRRMAGFIYAECLNDHGLGSNERYQRLWQDQTFSPWLSTLAVELGEIVDIHRKQSPGSLGNHIRRRLEVHQQALTSLRDKVRSEIRDKDMTLMAEQALHNLDGRLARLERLHEEQKSTLLQQNIMKLENAMDKLLLQKIPIIEVPDTIMVDADEEHDPALAILFKRIGTGGTALSDADYIFSVLKHRVPAIHAMVENLLNSNSRLRAIFSPTQLVLSIVRLVALQQANHPDVARLDKRQFMRMLRDNVYLHEQIKNAMQNDSEISQLLLEIVNDCFGYRGNTDIGLPTQSLCIIQVPMLEAVLGWAVLTQSNDVNKLEQDRGEIIRFLLRCYLTVTDPYRASELAIRWMKERKERNDLPSTFSAASLIEAMGELVFPLPEPKILEEIPDLTTSSSNATGLRGWRRFQKPDISEGEQRQVIHLAIDIYQRFWGNGGRYHHPLLLWLQRDYVQRKFKDAEPGTEEDTPYDYDHICPQSHWYNWRGIAAGNRLIDFHAQSDDEQGHWRLGNAIGNVRIWSSSDNRSDGDLAPREKLHTEEVRKDSLICSNLEFDAWVNCSAPPENSTHWCLPRALAFQEAIELRTFSLYRQYYNVVANQV